MNHLELAAFDLQPTPVLILSEDSYIVTANKACARLFYTSSSLIGLHVRDLPWNDGSSSALAHLFTRSSPNTEPRIHEGADHPATPLRNLPVRISRHEQHTTASVSITASLTVTEFISDAKPFRILSFENLTDIPSSSSDRSTDKNNDGHSFIRNADVEISSHVAHASTAKSQNQEHFSKLCDAIYHSDVRSGFLLSGDGTYCYPNYNSSRSTVAVEIDHVESYFLTFDAWDPTFTRRLDISEYPSVWLHRNRTKFRNRRCGLVDEGQQVVLDCSGDPLYDPSTGDFLGSVVWVTRLGTPAEVMASDLEKSLSDFESICDQLPHLLWTVNAAGSADYFSKSWYNFTGFTEDQSLGLAFTDAIDSTDMQNIWDTFGTATLSKTQIDCEARYRRHDGEWRWMNVRAKPFVDANGHILKWYGSSTEIDSLVKDRDRANNRKDQLMDMLTLADVGIFEALGPHSITLLEGRVKWLKERHENSLSADVNGEIVEEIARHIQIVIDGIHTKVAFEAKIDSRWYKIRLVLDKNMDGQRIVLGCSIDITEQKERDHLEVENQRLAHQTSLEVEKSRLKTRFLANMSHEIRTPIAGIIGITEMLAEAKLPDPQAECVNDIQLSANNLLTIINDILDFSKIEADQLQFEKIPYDLISVILDVKKLLWRTAKAKSLMILCSFDTSAHLDLTGDPGRVRQILSNLVSNAIKFTSEGAIEISIATDDHYIQILVRDRGEGIDQETMSRLFQPFVQGDASTARRHGGTGLGLTISRHLANGMGGKLDLKSEPGRGTNAILTLPKPAGLGQQWKQNHQNSAPDLPLRQQSRQNLKPPEGLIEMAPSATDSPLVLIVEDNAINQKVAVNLVRKLGYIVRTAWNGQEALSYLENCLNTHNDDVDFERNSTKNSYILPALILMDCQMPTLDGYEATNQVRSDPKFDLIKSVPIIALTASAIIGDREKCEAAGMDDYMSKPVTKAALDKMLRTWIPAN